jgi:hypothetical protein
MLRSDKTEKAQACILLVKYILCNFDDVKRQVLSEIRQIVVVAC